MTNQTKCDACGWLSALHQRPWPITLTCPKCSTPTMSRADWTMLPVMWAFMMIAPVLSVAVGIVQLARGAQIESVLAQWRKVRISTQGEIDP